MIHSVCTIADSRIYDELLIMLKSLTHFASLNIYVGGDRTVVERLSHEKIANKLHVHRLLPEVADSSIKQGQAGFRALVNCKMDIMQIALAAERNTLFVDADMVFLEAPWGLDLENYEVALSPHYILPADEFRWGRYNAGYVGTSTPAFSDWWKNAFDDSKWVEQECLVRAPRTFRAQELSIHHNFGWWRLNQCDPKRKWWRIDLPNRPVRAERLAKFRVEHDRILYDHEPLVSIHTHIKNRRKKCYQSANRLAVDLLSRSTDRRHKEILSWL